MSSDADVPSSSDLTALTTSTHSTLEVNSTNILPPPTLTLTDTTSSLTSAISPSFYITQTSARFLQMSAEVQKETVQPSGASAQNITSLGDNGVPSKKARETAAAALVGALVALFFFVIAVVLCVRRRRRGSAAAATERAHRFVDAPPDLQRLVRRGETDDAHTMGGTPFHRVTHPRRKGALRNAAPLRAGRTTSATQRVRCSRKQNRRWGTEVPMRARGRRSSSSSPRRTWFYACG